MKKFLIMLVFPVFYSCGYQESTSEVKSTSDSQHQIYQFYLGKSVRGKLQDENLDYVQVHFQCKDDDRREYFYSDWKEIDFDADSGTLGRFAISLNCPDNFIVGKKRVLFSEDQRTPDDESTCGWRKGFNSNYWPSNCTGYADDFD